MTDVRRIEPDDWRDWRAVRLRALTEAPEAFADSVRTAAVDSEDAFRGRIAAAEAAFVAYLDDAPVGQVAMDVMPDGRCQLMSMFVGAEARRSGVGAALIAAVVEAAGERQVHLRVMDGNTAAVRTYERAGFELDGAPADAEHCLTMVLVRSR